MPHTFSSKEQRAAKGFGDIGELFKRNKCDGAVGRGRRAQQRGKKNKKTIAAATAVANNVGAYDDTRARMSCLSRRMRMRMKSWRSCLLR